MIEIARTGAEVLRVANLATASLVNPEREASQWVSLQSVRLAAVRADEPVVVLGVGSGFHLACLRNQMKERGLAGRLIALDSCLESIAFAEARVQEVEFIRVDLEAGVENFAGRADISSWLAQSHTFLKHKPTVTRSGADLRTVESWILGRTPEAFSAQLKLRPQIAAALNATRATKIAECPLISIRDLSKIWDISSELKSDRRMFRVLEELVR